MIDHLFFFIWRLCCLSFDLRILITSLWYLQTHLIVIKRQMSSVLAIVSCILTERTSLQTIHY